MKSEKNLQNLDYCKRVLHISYPVLIKQNLSRQDLNGNNRYYKDEIVQGYWLCSQWVEKQWDSFLKWEKEILARGK